MSNGLTASSELRILAVLTLTVQAPASTAMAAKQVYFDVLSMDAWLMVALRITLLVQAYCGTGGRSVMLMRIFRSLRQFVSPLRRTRC
jgi:hypothetical protein